MASKKVLFIDDELFVLKSIKRQLELHDYEVYIATNAETAFTILDTENIPVVVSDQKMPDFAGSTLVSFIKEKYPHTIRMIISGYTDFEGLKEAVNKGEIFRFIPKPWDEAYLLNALESAFALYDARQ